MKNNQLCIEAKYCEKVLNISKRLLCISAKILHMHI